MIFRLLTILIFFCSGLVGTAQKCKYEIDEKDPLTDDIIRTVKNRITGPTPYYYFSYIRKGEDYKVLIEVGDYGELSHTIPANSTLFIRLEDGSILKAISEENASPKIIQDFGQKITEFKVSYSISGEDMRKIAESGIVFMRASELKNSFSDQKFPQAVTKISLDNAKCIFK